MIKYLVSIAITALTASVALGDEAGWERTVTAAKKEGSVVLYGGLAGAEQEEIIRNFERQYGIKVQWFQARQSETNTRIRSEQAAGRYVADVLQSAKVVVDGLAEEGIVSSPSEIPNQHQLRIAVQPKQGLPTLMLTHGILVNTDLVSADHVPKKWSDLLDPYWRGKVVMDDPTAGGAAIGLFEAAYEKFGKQFWITLAQSKPDLTVNNREAERQVARGEYSAYFPHMLSYALKLDGLPVKWVVPSEGAIFAQFDAAVFKNSPHPNAALVFINYLLDKKSQLAYGNGGYVPVINGLENELNPSVRDLVPTKFLGTSTRERYPFMISEAKGLFGK
ncbi:ABC transporter substrate-binding protein [Microvirga zambiensis]|uniref:ABC transporter substrate-binding protein n=1 Tax=Microvirga zambiensis TaxID=1402137 RepID=UPI00191DBAF0|nr:extracellular solute-binding protein [Microvirga zambiensis]